MGAGVKDIEGKPRLDLIPYAALKAVASVREYGNKKYKDPGAWYNAGIGPDHFVAAALRHIGKYNDSVYYGNRSELDEESGLAHLDHALTSLAMAVALRDKEKGETK